MDLKQHLTNTLNAMIEGYKFGIKSTKKSLKDLEKTPVENADYLIKLTSLWADCGESPTITEHHGNLKGAIEKAEADFKSINNRGDVQANYFVQICLGDKEYPVPNDYWEKFCDYYKSDKKFKLEQNKSRFKS